MFLGLCSSAQIHWLSRKEGSSIVGVGLDEEGGGTSLVSCAKNEKYSFRVTRDGVVGIILGNMF